MNTSRGIDRPNGFDFSRTAGRCNSARGFGVKPTLASDQRAKLDRLRQALRTAPVTPRADSVQGVISAIDMLHLIDVVYHLTDNVGPAAVICLGNGLIEVVEYGVFFVALKVLDVLQHSDDCGPVPRSYVRRCKEYSRCV